MGRGEHDDAWHNELYARWRVPVIRWLAYLVGPDYGSFEDLAQEVFIIAWQKKESRAAGNPRAWLFEIARRVAANHRRGRARFDANLLLLFPLQRQPGDDYATVAVRQDFLQAFLTLKPNEQEAFYLQQCGLTAEEIAKVVGSLSATVRQRISRARHKLGRHMQDYNRPAPPQPLTRTGGPS